MFTSSESSEVITTSVLLTDGSFKHTLAAVRSLGSKGIETTVVDSSFFAQSFYSRKCNKRYLVPTPSASPKNYVMTLKRILTKTHHDVILPIGWEANYYISMYRHLLEPYSKIPIADHTNMTIAANKDKTMKFANKIGIPIPLTYFPERQEDIDQIIETLNFPLVIKGSVDAGHVFYAHSKEELLNHFKRLRKFHPIVQEYIQGYGCGFFALYDRGKCRAFFMHRRIREYPLTGGPSTAAEAYYSKDLLYQGKKLLDALDWHGVAMVEFKRDASDGKYKLMEINPKFWGSLELAIVSGVDFPYLTYKMAMGEKFEPIEKYNTNSKFRWPFPGDLLHYLSAGRMSKFIKLFGDSRYEDDVVLRDIGPLSMQLVLTLNSLRRR